MNITIIEKTETQTGWQFKVRLSEGTDPLDFEVELDNNYFRKLTDLIITPEKLVQKSFQFLLAHERPHSILKNFNIRDIQTYFPEYEDQISS